MAIALMVIGLLIGGVLKGQELIENARMTQLIRQLKSYDTAIMIFRNTYNAIPGDMKNPSTRVPNCTDEQCILTGNGDGRLTLNDSERVNFWIYMERAGIISGLNTKYNGSAANLFRRISPLTPFDGNIAIKWKPNAQLSGTLQQPDKHYFYLNSAHHVETVPLNQTTTLDQKMDDGKPYTGSVRADGGTFGDICYDSESNNEYLTDPALRCHVLIEAPSAN